MAIDSKLDTFQAAAHIGVTESTLRCSRSTGKLSGVKPPRYSKRGRSVIYTLDDLNEWLSQFQKITCTKQLNDTREANP